ncbi:hypothetical protein RSAG8_09048, partial [Rhizoctonia solani AG-8 WAC10335]
MSVGPTQLFVHTRSDLLYQSHFSFLKTEETQVGLAAQRPTTVARSTGDAIHSKHVKGRRQGNTPSESLED